MGKLAAEVTSLMSLAAFDSRKLTSAVCCDMQQFVLIQSQATYILLPSTRARRARHELHSMRRAVESVSVWSVPALTDDEAAETRKSRSLTL